MTSLSRLMIVLILSAAGVDLASAQSMAFTYQGRLEIGSIPWNTSCDFEFRLFDNQALGIGTQKGSPIIANGVEVINGVFTRELDFGAQFDGTPRFLEIRVICLNSGLPQVTLPRQAITATPYAIRAHSAGTVPWSGITGVPAGLNDGDNDTTYTAGTGLTLSSNQFSVNTSTIQQRVTGACAAGSSISGINANGTVSCETDNDTTYTSGTGLTLSSNQFSVGTPFRLPQGCTNNQIPEWNGSGWSCGTDDGGALTLPFSSSLSSTGVLIGVTNTDNTTNNAKGLYGSSAGMGVGVQGETLNGIGVLARGTSSGYALYAENVSNTNPALFVKNNASGPLILASDNNAERFRVNANGNVGIGVSNPTIRLELASGSHFGVDDGPGTLRLDDSWIEDTGNNSILRLVPGGGAGATIQLGSLATHKIRIPGLVNCDSGIVTNSIGELSCYTIPVAERRSSGEARLEERIAELETETQSLRAQLRALSVQVQLLQTTREATAPSRERR